MIKDFITKYSKKDEKTEKEKKFDEDYYLSWSRKIDNHLADCKKIIQSLHGNIVGL